MLKPFRPVAERLQNSWNNFREKQNTRRERRALDLLATTSHQSVVNGSRSQRRAVLRALQVLERRYSHCVRNWYESGRVWNDGTRSNVGNYSTDARYDQNPTCRRTIESRCRHWEQNSPVMKSALDVHSRYVIGTHMPVVTSLASNPEWQAVAETVFHEMCESAGLNGESMFAQLTVGHRRKKVDGNILFVETNKPGKVIYRRGTRYQTEIDVLRPCYQLVESQRIGTPWQQTENVVDGVQYKEIETRLAGGQIRKQLVKAGYWVNDYAGTAPSQMTSPESFVFVPAENCYYATTAHRVNEPRGISDFYAVEPTLALLEDLLKMEMRAQEVQSDLTVFITNGAGQIINEKTQATVGALGIKVEKNQNGDAIVTAKDIQKAQEIYKKIWGGNMMVGRTGDTLSMLAPTRPADATLNLWNYLIDSFCSGSESPRLLVFPKFNKGQGTEVRAEIESANSAFIKEFNLVWKPFIHRAWKYFIGWAINYDERLKNPPSDWEHIEVSPPRSIVVDLGYDSAAKLAELAAGVSNLHQWAQDLGTTKGKLIQQSVADVFDIKLACAKRAEQAEYKKYGITVDAAEVRGNLVAAVQALSASKAAEAAKTTVEETEPEEVPA